MTVADLVMLGMAVLGGASALLVVTARNVVHAALLLVVALLSVAGAFLVIGAEFLAWAQVLVYVGAVVVLILFGLMLTRAPIGPLPRDRELGRVLPVVTSGGLFAVLVVAIFASFGDVVLTPTWTPTASIGELLYVEWAFPFMALGFLLTVALIGAIIMARKEEGEGPDPQLDAELRSDRPTPAPTDASSTPGVTRPSEEVTA